MTAGEIKQLLHVPENLEPISTDAKNFGKVLALVALLNTGANKLAEKSVAHASEAFFSAMAPVIGGHLRTLIQHTNAGALRMVQAMLARSQQRLEAEALTQRQFFEFMTAQVEATQNKSKIRRLKKDMAKIEESEARAARKQMASSGSTESGAGSASKLTQQLKEYPYLHIVPLGDVARPDHPAPGYGSNTPNRTPVPDNNDLPPMSKSIENASPRLTLRDLLSDAPLKVLITVFAVWNLSNCMDVYEKNNTRKNTVGLTSAAFGLATAFSAVFQQIAEVKWNVHAASAGTLNPASQALLVNALRIGAGTLLLQSVTTGVDVIAYGWDALESYNAGDMDTAAVDIGMSAASIAYMPVSIQMFRAMRVARAAVILGEASAIGRGVSVIPLPLLAQTAGLVITIFGGMISLLYTRDTPLEAWVKQTCFGIRPAVWSDSYEETMKAYYQVVTPVSMEIRRWNDINPVSGNFVKEVRLVLLLSGQSNYEQGMVSFSGYEEWTSEKGLLDFSAANVICKPLVWEEEDRIPLYQDSGSRVPPEPGGALRLSAAYHKSDGVELTRIRGTLTYQPIDGLYLPPVEIDED
jgi:hypothetical protein